MLKKDQKKDHEEEEISLEDLIEREVLASFLLYSVNDVVC